MRLGLVPRRIFRRLHAGGCSSVATAGFFIVVLSMGENLILLTVIFASLSVGSVILINEAQRTNSTTIHY